MDKAATEMLEEIKRIREANVRTEAKRNKARKRIFEKAAANLKPEDNPAPADFEDEIREAAARIFFVSAWADARERSGESFSGMDLMDCAPETPAEALAFADAWLERFETPPAARFALMVCGGLADARDVEDFGFALAHEGMGSGVSWEDDRDEPHGLLVPYCEEHELGLPFETPNPDGSNREDFEDPDAGPEKPSETHETGGEAPEPLRMDRAPDALKREALRLRGLRRRALAGNVSTNDEAIVKKIRELVELLYPSGTIPARGRYYRSWSSVARIKRANVAAGCFSFQPAARRFFGLRTVSKVIGGRYYVESLKPPRSARCYVVKVVDDFGRLESVERPAEADGATDGGGSGLPAFRTKEHAYAYAWHQLPAYPAPYFRTWELSQADTLLSGHFGNVKANVRLGYDGVLYSATLSRMTMADGATLNNGITVESLDANGAWSVCGAEYPGGISAH